MAEEQGDLHDPFMVHTRKTSLAVPMPQGKEREQEQEWAGFHPQGLGPKASASLARALQSSSEITYQKRSICDFSSLLILFQNSFDPFLLQDLMLACSLLFTSHKHFVPRQLLIVFLSIMETKSFVLQLVFSRRCDTADSHNGTGFDLVTSGHWGGFARANKGATECVVHDLVMEEHHCTVPLLVLWLHPAL